MNSTLLNHTLFQNVSRLAPAKLLIFLLLCSNLFAAKYYWVGNTGNWNDLTKWSKTSGGPGSQYVQVPGSNDTVYFDVNSFTGTGRTVTVATTAVCGDMDWTGSTTTYSGAVNGPSLKLVANLDIFGSLTLATGMRDILIPTIGVNLTFRSNTPGRTIRSNGVAIGPTASAYQMIVFDNPAGSWTFLDAFTTKHIFCLTSGTLNTNNQSVICGALQSNSGAVRTLNLGSSSVQILCVGGPVSFSATNFTFNAGTSTIIFKPLSYGIGPAFFSCGGFTYYNIVSYHENMIFYNGGATFNSLFLKANTMIENALIINDTLLLGAGKKISLTKGAPSSITIGASGTLATNATCANYTEVKGSGNTFTKTGGWGTTTLNYIIFSRITAAGGGSITVNNGYDGGLNVNFIFNPVVGQTLYWIGNSGNWRDAAHWSYNSGGVSSGCIPGPNDDVVFDNNSFTLATQSVTVDSSDAYCRNMTWTAGVFGTPAFTTNGLDPWRSNKIFSLHGSLTFTNNMTTSFTLPFHFKSALASTITSAGQGFDCDLFFSCTGSYTFNDAFKQRYTLPYGIIGANLVYGAINTNNQDVTWVSFNNGFSMPTGYTRALDLGSSIVTINNVGTSAHTAVQRGWWMDGQPTMSFNAGTSKIYIRSLYSKVPTAAAYFTGGPNRTYNFIQFCDTVYASNATQFIVDSMVFLGSGIITNNNTYTGVLKFTGNNEYNFESGKTQTFTGSGTLDANGGCSGIINITTSSSTQATLSKTTGSVTASNVTLTNIKGAGGISYTANNSVDLGGNSGWTINTGSGRILYWVGGSGGWRDASHWSLTTGGTGGECVPTMLDSVVFDVNSFTAGSKTVTINTGNAYCKGFTWLGTVSGATLATSSNSNQLNFYGSVTLNSTMSVTFNGGWNFKNRGHFSCSGLSLNGVVTFDMRAGGTYILDDNLSLNTASADIFFISGTLNTNNKNISCRYFRSENQTYTRALILGSSTITCNWFGMTDLYAASHTASNLTISAGTSTINACTRFFGGAQTYYRVIIASCSFPGGQALAWGSNTYKSLYLYNGGNNTLLHDNFIINDSLYVAPGSTVTLVAGITVSFSDTCDISLIGTGVAPIFLNTNIVGTYATLTKAKGKVCADYIYIRDNRATGGAKWYGGGNANNQGNNPGWDFSPYPLLGAGTLSGSGFSCPGSSTTLNFAFTQNYFPKVLIIKKEVAGVTIGYDTITILTNPASYSVSPSVTTVYTLFKCTIDRCWGGEEAVNGSATVTMYTGTAGLWAGRTNSDWFVCSNWDDGTIPTSITNVVIPTGLSTYPVINTAGAVCNNITIQSGSSIIINNSASTLTVYGNFSLSGSLSHSAGSVTFTGASANNLNGTQDYTFYRLIVNNSNGVIMNRSVTINNLLDLSSGYLSINGNTLSLFGTIINSGTISGSSASTLNIGGTGNIGTLNFTAGNRMISSLNMNRTSNGRATLGTPLTITSLATLNNGVIYSSSTNYLEFSDNASSNGAGDNSFINGPVLKTGNDPFTFPIGKNSEYHWCAIEAPAVVTDQFSAEYFDVNPLTTFGTQKAASLDHVSICNYWNISRTNGGSTVNVTLSWNSNSCGFWSGISSPADIVVAHWFNTTPVWEDLGNGAYSGNSTTGSVTSSINSSSFSPFTLASRIGGGSNPLPIELLSFTAQKNNSTVDIKWTTATEINNDYFTVERSRDGFIYEAVNKKKGAGNSSVKINYTDVDLNPYSSTSYYRLKQTDFDGKFSYSGVIPVNFDDKTTIDFSVYPNPVKVVEGGTAEISMSGLGNETSALVVLYDIIGKEYYSKVVVTNTSGQTSFIISSEALAKGIYIISASSNDKLLSKKIVIE